MKTETHPSWDAACAAMERFIVGIPDSLRCELHGDRGIAAWRVQDDAIIARGREVARALGMEVGDDGTGGWRPRLSCATEILEDGSVMRVDYHARRSPATTSQSARSVITYIRHW